MFILNFQKNFFVLSSYLIKIFNFFNFFNLFKSKQIQQKLIDPKRFEYIPVTYEQFNLIINQFKTKLKANRLDNCSFFNKINLISIKIKKLFDLADRYSCAHTKANGYYSVLRIISNISECALNEFASFENQTNSSINQLKQLIIDYEELADLSLILIDKLIQLVDLTNLKNEQKLKDLNSELAKYPKSLNSKIFKQIKVRIDDNDQMINSLPLLSPNLKLICDSIYEAINQIEHKKSIVYRKFVACYLKFNLNLLYKIFMFSVASLKVHFYQLPKLMYDNRFKSDICNQISCCVTKNFPFEYLDILEMPLQIITRCLTFNSNTKCKQIEIPSQTSIIINRSIDDKLTINDLNKINFDENCKIKCRFLSPKNVNLQHCDKLLIHLHGGGWYCLSGKVTHDIYLLSWIDHYQIPILTVDYALKQPFPRGLKDAFDVYIWLRKASENEVRSLIGYYPTQLIIVGESSGGNFGLAITLILNDLRNDSKFKISIKMPDGLSLFYSPLFISVYASPSRSISTFDILLSTGILLIIWEGISGLIPNLKPNTIFEKILLFLFPSRDQSSWLNWSEEDKFKQRIEFLAKNVTSTYLSPLFYDKFDQITDVPVYLVSAEACPFLDDFISLAKIYKGPLKVDVFAGMSHGFLHYGGSKINRNLFEAMLYCGQETIKLFK